MEDMNDMLGSLLSDPESMQQIKELADMLKSEMPSDGKSRTVRAAKAALISGALRD